MLVLVLEVREARDSDSEASKSKKCAKQHPTINTNNKAGKTTQKAASEMSAAIFESYVTIMFTIRVIIIIIYVFEDMYVQARKAFLQVAQP